MQLTPTTDATLSTRGRAGWAARLNRPAAAGLIALAGWIVFAAARLADWAGGKLSLFIESGTTYSHPSLMWPRISHTFGKGYDGQFYYRFSFNPFNWHMTAYGITIDHPYRYTRIGYSVVVWLLSGGGHGRLIPFLLVAVNVLSVAAMAWLGAVLARDSGRHALWGLLFAAYFGLVISVGRDTSEPLADACLLAGLIAYRRSRYIVAAVLIAYAVFTNEPILAFPVALALTRLGQTVRHRVKPGLPDLVWLAPGALYLVLQAVQRLVVHGTAGGVADASANLTFPFAALVPGVAKDIRLMSWSHLGLFDYNLLEFIVLALFLLAGLAALVKTTAPVHERVAFVCFVAIEVVLASGQFWDSTFGDGRTYVDAYLMAVVMLLAVPGRILSGRRLGWLAAVAVAALVLVARRRILFE